MKDNNIQKRINKGIVIIVLLSLSLLFTSTVLALSVVNVDNNVFTTALLNIKIGGYNNDGSSFFYDKPMIDENDVLVPEEPLVKEFFVQNIDGKDNEKAWLRVYFDKAEGNENIEVKLIDTNFEDEIVLYEGIVKNYTKDNVIPTLLVSNEEHKLRMEIIYPLDEEESYTSGELLSFDIHADAIQYKNNENGEVVE